MGLSEWPSSVAGDQGWAALTRSGSGGGRRLLLFFATGGSGEIRSDEIHFSLGLGGEGEREYGWSSLVSPLVAPLDKDAAACADAMLHMKLSR